ncbi:uncharacterized protein LOC135340388 isoform X3 [Halichondria panicea]|uniref:uncharacterized protein LOC135340388 isoform X3 n=1 Tax=Halichondria panicea TaxID=6063 RepID=UPI00312B84C0
MSGAGDTNRGPNSLKLKDVYTVLYDVTDQWFDIGLQLDVDSNDLKRIFNEGTLQNNKEKLREMLIVRLAQGDLTWDQIIEALENPTICQQVIADEIRSKHITPQPATTVETANSMPTMAPTVTVTPVTSTSNTATKTRTTTITAATSSQPPSTFKEPIDLLPNYIPKGNTNSTWERSPYSTPMARKRPASNTLSESSKRPKPLDAEFYNEYMFVSKSSIKKYQCIHCKKIPKRFFRCKCGKVDEKQESKGRARFDGNTGLSCSNCKIYPCTNCVRSDQYEPDKVTNSNIGKLKVFCENKCGEKITLTNQENRSHVRNECSKRKRSCKYAWAGCKIEGTGDVIEQHEKKCDVHVLAAIDKLHEPQSATTTIPPVERAFAANIIMPTMATTATVTPATSTATKTLTTTITAATSNQPLSILKEPSTSTILINALPRGILNFGLPSTIVPNRNINRTREENHSSTPMARKRPANNTSPESSKRPKTLDAEFYNEDIFVNKKNLTKYQCTHCKKLPKSFFRCKCGKVDEKQEIGKGKPRFEDNTGLSCSDCKIRPCSNCGRNDQYEPDKVTNSNIRMLKVFCENKCDENITIVNLENRSHVRNKCSKRKRSCKYTWAGCTHEGTGDEIEKHEKKSDVHVLAAIEKLHKENLELRKDNSDLKKDNLDLSKRIKMIEAKLNPGSSGPLTTQPAIISQLRI